ncbi:MAG: FkbM family methyltransferase [Bacteroidia bacterium]|nr:FkbM family methyltransferase [Bacteroidia bacterium]
MNWRPVAARLYYRTLSTLGIYMKSRYGFKWYPELNYNFVTIFHWHQHPEEWDIRFIQRFLQPGDTFIDIGAHHGLYTLIAGMKVRPSGKVISFEPSPRERKRLARHVRLNRLQSVVQIEGYALSKDIGETEFFVARDYDSGMNSLAATEYNTRNGKRVKVSKITLDRYITHRNISEIKLIKMDAEGAELDILRGSTYVLEHIRPVWLIEVEEERTAPWGYSAHDIIDFMDKTGYTWYKSEEAGIRPLSPEEKALTGNYIAIPQEKTYMLANLVQI